MNKIDIPRAVVVLGMHRSGTSVLMRAFAALGVNIGDRLLSGLPENPKGFFEDKCVHALNIEFLQEMGCRWDSLDVGAPSPELIDRFLPRAITLLREQFGKSILWGFKEPRVTRLLPFWQRVLEEVDFHPIFILANRHPLSVADSLAKRNGMPRGQSLALWLQYQASGLEAILINGGLVVDYDLMMQEPDKQLRRLADVLVLPFDLENPEISVFTSRFLEQKLRHSEYGRDGSDLRESGLEDICQALYLYLCTLANFEDSIPEPLQRDGRVLIDRIQHYFSMHKEWMKMVDDLICQREKLTQEIKEYLNNSIAEKKAKIRRLESQLAWVKNNRTYQILVKLQQFLLSDN